MCDENKDYIEEDWDEFDIAYEKEFPSTGGTYTLSEFKARNKRIREWCDKWFAEHPDYKG